jgi:hypothetical protein
MNERMVFVTGLIEVLLDNWINQLLQYNMGLVKHCMLLNDEKSRV